MSTVREIAKTAGVSIGTVSRVLNDHPQVSEDARRKVLAVANREQYPVPSASAGRQLSATNIALLYTGAASLGSDYDAALMHGISSTLEREGLDLLVLTAGAHHKATSISRMLRGKGVRGVLVRTTSDTRSVIGRLAEEKFPAVVIADSSDDRLPYVHCDASEAVGRAVRHLVDQGHRRIGITLNVVDDQDHTLRLEAYRAALREADIELDSRLIYRVPANRDSGAALLRQIAGASEQSMTALLTTDPVVGVAVVQEAARIGYRIPEQLSVVGFDDTTVRYSTTPTLSAVCQDALSVGSEALSLLLRMIDQPQANYSPVTMQAWFEVHGTTSSPAASATNLA